VVTFDYLENIINQTVPPGCFIYPLHETIDSPRWVAGGQRLIWLGDAAQTGLDIASAGTATFTPPTPGVAAPGRLVYLRKPYRAFETHPQVPVYPVLGKVIAVDPGTGVATVKWVPNYVTSSETFDGTPVGAGDEMYIVGFYKVHQPMTGTVTSGSNV